MRTLNPILQNGLDNNIGNGIIKLVGLNTGLPPYIFDVLEYTLDNFDLVVIVPFSWNAPDVLNQYLFRLRRGLNIDGTDYTVDSSVFAKVNIDATQHGYAKLKLRRMYNLSVSTPGDVATQTAILAAIQQTDLNIYYTDTIIYKTLINQWWKNTQFLPDGKRLDLNNAATIDNMMQQKYFARLMDAGDDSYIAFSDTYRIEYNSAFGDVPPFDLVLSGPNDAVNAALFIDYEIKQRENIGYKVRYTNEFGTVTQIGTTGVEYNLGFIKSGTTPILPSRDEWIVSYKISPPNLAMQNGDYILPGGMVTIKEVYNPRSTPTWYLEVKTVDPLQNTPGGAMPSTMERVSNYTPLSTAGFNRFLSVASNNLQAFADWVNDFAMNESQVLTVIQRQPIGYGQPGEQGEDGQTIAGPMGPTGTQGIRGYTGEQGEPGEDATPGMASSGSLYWTTYTPSWASTGTTPTIGNGSITGKWIRINPFTVLWKIKLTWGSTTNGGTGVWLFGAPVTAIDTSAYSEPGGAVLNDSSSGQHIGQVIKFNATSVYVQTDVAPNGITAISDFTWAVNDTLLTQSIWEA